MSEILLIGGSNVDYIATSRDKLIPKTSNIGIISISSGGVMRNVTYNLANLGNKCHFITAIGKDSDGDKIIQELEDKNVSVYTPLSSLPTSKYVAMNDNNHDMITAICDNRIINDLTLNFVLNNKELINKFEYIILDSNLSEPFISDLYHEFWDKKFIVEAISRVKVRRFIPFLKNTYLVKCNIFEAKEIVGDDSLDGEELLDKFIELGIKNAVISRGGDSILFIDNLKKGEVKLEKQTNFKNTTGCGDDLFSGIIDSLMQKKSLKEAIEFGVKLSTLTLFDEKACSDSIQQFKHE